MSKNLILVSALCVDNPINVLFFDSFFQVQDCHTGVTLVRRQCRDGVYYLLKSVPLQSSTLALYSSALSSLTFISMWHSRLGHPSLPIFQKFLRVLSFFFQKNIYVFSLITPIILIKATSYLFLNQASPLSLHLMSSFLLCGPHPFPLLMVFILHYFC